MSMPNAGLRIIYCMVGEEEYRGGLPARLFLAFQVII